MLNNRRQIKINRRKILPSILYLLKIYRHGFLYSSKWLLHYLLPCYSGCRKHKIRTAKGFLSATVVSSDEGLDIAILKVSGNDFNSLPLISSSSVKTGQKVFTIGFPNIGIQGSESKYTEGVISSLTGMQNNPRFFQISVSVQPGNSGGPLVDDKGRVVGIVTAKLDDIASLVATGSIPQTVNYAVKSSFVLSMLEGC